MEILFIFALVPLILFDVIPSIFGGKGLINWYTERHNTYADSLFMAFYVPFGFISLILLIHFL